MSAPPVMSFRDRADRAEEKRQLVLNFLASGELYSSVAIFSRLLNCSPRSAARTLDGMVRDMLLKSEAQVINLRRTMIYGITQHGLGMADQMDARAFEIGRQNPSYIPHHLDTQLARLAAEAAGWHNWIPGRTLAGKGLMAVPDAMATSPSGREVAIEIERHVKTKKRYEEIMVAHLQAIKQRQWGETHYLCPGNMASKVKAIFDSIDEIQIDGQRVKIEQRHHDAFKFFAQSEWPSAQENEIGGQK